MIKKSQDILTPNLNFLFYSCPLLKDVQELIKEITKA